MYTIGKIDPNVISGCEYDRHFECESFAALSKFLDEHPGLFSGKGSDVLNADGQILFHSSDFLRAAKARNWLGNRRTIKPTLKNCVASYQGEYEPPIV